MLARAILNTSLRLNGPLVMHIDIVAHTRVGLRQLLVHIVSIVVAAITTRYVIGQFIQFKPLFAHPFFIHRAGKAGENGIPIASFIINRNMPLRNRHFRTHGDYESLGEHQIRDANMGLIFRQMTQCR